MTVDLDHYYSNVANEQETGYNPKYYVEHYTGEYRFFVTADRA